MRRALLITTMAFSLIACTPADSEMNKDKKVQTKSVENQEKDTGDTGEMMALSEISVVKGVSGIAREGKVIRFTIPKDAKAFDDAASGAISAIYDSAKGKPSECPVFSSTLISKDVGEYHAMSGEAKITATFDKESDASKAMDAGCLVVDDR